MATQLGKDGVRGLNPLEVGGVCPLKTTWSPQKRGVHFLKENSETFRKSIETWVCGIQKIISEVSLFRVNVPLFAARKAGGKILYEMLHNCSVRKEPHPKAKLLTKKSAGARVSPGSECM